jgi:hypothetical protein
MEASLTNASKNAVSDYLTAIENTLSDAQKDNLVRTLEKYSTPHQAASNP